uniref:Uncharacterized protein n=1 Tax=Lactuca sativa TaxID=4236 RepID=A0A9R1WIR9_LACSA|nr:hypothetical protein LSAT_V11C100014830 [Lactuca sativa]
MKYSSGSPYSAKIFVPEPVGDLEGRGGDGYVDRRLMETEILTSSLQLMNQECFKLGRFDARKIVDPNVIFYLDKRRALRKDSEELCVGHIKNSQSEWL